MFFSFQGKLQTGIALSGSQQSKDLITNWFPFYKESEKDENAKGRQITKRGPKKISDWLFTIWRVCAQIQWEVTKAEPQTFRERVEWNTERKWAAERKKKHTMIAEAAGRDRVDCGGDNHERAPLLFKSR